MIRAGDFLGDQSVRRREGAPESPAVSVILPTYRRREGSLLERAIRSVLGQTFGDLELIVVVDGSNDGSDLIRSLQTEDPRLVHVRHEANCGLPALRVDEGIELARGGLLGNDRRFLVAAPRGTGVHAGREGVGGGSAAFL